MINNNGFVPPAPGPRRVYLITERIIIFSLALYALFAPHSIAVTQSAYLIGLAAWVVQLVATGRLRHRRTPVDIALFGFFACCVVSSFLSYDPLVSIKGLRSPAFFLAFYFVANNVKSLGFAKFLAFALVGSCLINIGYSAWQIGVGRGLRIDSISEESPFRGQGLRVGDVILQADDQKVQTDLDLLQVIDSKRGRLRIKFKRGEADGEASVSRLALKEASGVGVERLGITTSPGRNFRVSGLYSHYETYAEVLQLIASLAVGMLIAQPRKRSATAIWLAAMISLMCVALILTSTRAPMMGLAAAAAVMALASYRRRTFVVAALAIMVLAPLALVALERSRGVSLFDPEEGSTAYRLEVWREAFGLIRDHPLVGIGKGSEAKLKESLGLYDEGRLPPGHFHSTPIQIAAWWGLPALIFYFSLMAILACEAWRLSKHLRAQEQWTAWGITLGCIGAIVAFNVSSLAHFNFGDGEVVMAFWLLTGLLFAIRKLAFEARDERKPGIPQSQASQEHSYKNRPQEQGAASEPSARAAGARRNS